MTINDQFLKFYDNIKLTPAQRDDAVTKHTGVCKKLHDYYYPNIEYNGSTKLLIGSYAKHTHIRPARDIDVIFIMPMEKFDQYDDNQSNCQAQLLQDVKKILEGKYPNTPIRADEKVVVLEFADTKHDVELLPAWENEDGTFKIPNSANGGSWKNWDPRSEIKKISDSEETTRKTRALIRMVKKWSENCSAKIKSYKIEDAVISFLNIYTDYDLDYPVLVRNFFEYFHGSTADENLKSHLSTALNRAKKACDFEDNNKLDDAVAEWQKVFGDDFYITLEKGITDGIDDKIQKLYIVYPSAKEEYLDKNYGIKTTLNPAYSLKIDAEVQQNGFRNALLSSFLLRKLPLRKSKKLIFKIVKNTVPTPFDIKWKVRNFGTEAKDANDLRGEISDDQGLAEKKENTKYMGEHYVECYIIKSNTCIAKDRILVPISSDY